MSSLPVVVLTGFLGAGKTTLLRKILKHSGTLRIGVVLNEIGAAGIDPVSALAFKELTEACACCVRSDDFEASMQAMAARGDLDLVILETTGTADPLPIMWRLERLQSVALECVVTAVDASNTEPYVRDEWIGQVQSADWIVLTKTDLSAAEPAMAAVRDVQSRARFVSADTIADTLLTRPSDLAARTLPAFLVPRHTRLHGMVLRERGVFSAEHIERVFEELPADVVRAKAIVCTDAGWINVQRVGTRMHVEHDQSAPEHGESRFAFFAETLDEAALRAAIQSGVSSHLRRAGDS